MKIKSVTELHEQAPGNATHVLKRGDEYEYANFTGFNYDSCENTTMDEMLKNPTSANNNWFFKIGTHDWEVYLKLSECR